MGSTFSAPSMTVNGNSVNISAVGPQNRLMFYWAVTATHVAPRDGRRDRQRAVANGKPSEFADGRDPATGPAVRARRRSWP